MSEKEEPTAPPNNIWDTSAPGNRDYISLFKGSANFQALEPMLDAAAVSVGTRVLDIGTGLHAIAVGAALQRGAVPTGSDIGENLIALTKEEFPGVEFKAADAADLPFADASVDAAVCGFSVLRSQTRRKHSKRRTACWHPVERLKDPPSSGWGFGHRNPASEILSNGVAADGCATNGEDVGVPWAKLLDGIRSPMSERPQCPKPLQPTASTTRVSSRADPVE